MQNSRKPLVGSCLANFQMAEIHSAECQMVEYRSIESLIVKNRFAEFQIIENHLAKTQIVSILSGRNSKWYRNRTAIEQHLFYILIGLKPQ